MKKINSNSEDDFLYDYILKFLYEIKIVQGGNALSATLRRHKNLKSYLIDKQVSKLARIEDEFFTDDGLNHFAIESHNHQKSLQNN